jgi:hypothetical protein
LIKEPGLYKLGYGNNYKYHTGGTALLRVFGRGEAPPARGTGERRGFFTALPFVLRPARTDDIIPRGQVPANGAVYAVQDAAGPAALIAPYPGGAVILRRREFPPCRELFFCDIGGIDAYESKR